MNQHTYSSAVLLRSCVIKTLNRRLSLRIELLMQFQKMGTLATLVNHKYRGLGSQMKLTAKSISKPIQKTGICVLEIINQNESKKVEADGYRDINDLKWVVIFFFLSFLWKMFSWILECIKSGGVITSSLLFLSDYLLKRSYLNGISQIHCGKSCEKMTHFPCG